MTFVMVVLLTFFAKITVVITFIENDSLKKEEALKSESKRRYIRVVEVLLTWVFKVLDELAMGESKDWLVLDVVGFFVCHCTAQWPNSWTMHIAIAKTMLFISFSVMLRVERRSEKIRLTYMSQTYTSIDDIMSDGVCPLGDMID